MSKPPLIMRVPRGLREQPAWIFIGILLVSTGLSFAFGYTESMVSRAIGPSGLQIWGTALTVAGGLLIAAVIKAKYALEKLALRIMTCTLMTYAGYLLTVASFKRTALSVVLVFILCSLAEFRAMHLKALLYRANTLAKELGADND